MLLTEEQLSVQDMARRFAQERLAPNSERWDREHHYPADAIREMADLGFFGMLVPEEWDGNASGYLSYAVALEEIAAGNGACSTIMSVHNSVACMPILKYGSDAQKDQFLRPLATGAAIGGFALTEPQAGSDASSLRTRAVRDGDHYVLNGAKQFITSGRTGQLVIVFAVTDPQAGKRGISAFIVPTDTPGYQVVRVEDKLGQHLSDTCQIAFEDMRIPAAWRLGEEGRATRSRCRTWRAAASASLRSRSAWRARRSNARATTPVTARPSANPSWSTRRCRSGWPTWPRRSTRRGRWCCTRRRCARPAGRR